MVERFGFKLGVFGVNLFAGRAAFQSVRDVPDQNPKGLVLIH